MMSVKITLLSAVILVFVVAEVYGQDEPTQASSQYPPPIDPNIQLGPNTTFLVAGTIMGLAVFGSVLGFRIERKPQKKDMAWLSKIWAFIALVILIVIQGIFMLIWLAGGSLYTAWVWIVVTTCCLIFITATVTLGNSYSTVNSSDE